MPRLIKDAAIVNDDWQILGLEEFEPEMTVPSENVIIPLAVWQAQKDTLANRKSTLGVWLNSDQLADELGEDCEGLAVVALRFPTFMDGRGFTAARLLRSRFGYSGEIRAIGHIIRDQLFYLKRCGFNSFSFSEEVDLEAALDSLNDFSESYQAAADQSAPLFRRRA